VARNKKSTSVKLSTVEDVTKIATTMDDTNYGNFAPHSAIKNDIWRNNNTMQVGRYILARPAQARHLTQHGDLSFDFGDKADSPLRILLSDIGCNAFKILFRLG